MSATTGYFLPGESWLHRRNPLTKLLGLGFVLLTAFLLPPMALVPLTVALAVLGWSSGLLGPMLRALRIPAVLLASIVVINAILFPGASERWLEFGPFALTREGVTFGLVSAGRLLAVFLASVLFLFTTLADDLLEALVSRGVSHRIAFVVLSAVQLVPRLQARAGSILAAQQARGLQVEGSITRRLRALVPLIGPVVLGSLIDVRERTFALEARGFGARRDRTAYRLVADPPMDRWIRLALLLASVLVVVAVLSGTVR
jgi:energy-coupling factor transport system permease protein